MGVGGRGSSRNGRLEMLHSGQTAFPCNAIKRNSIQFNAIRIYEASGDVLEHPGASGSIREHPGASRESTTGGIYPCGGFRRMSRKQVLWIRRMATWPEGKRRRKGRQRWERRAFSSRGVAARLGAGAAPGTPGTPGTLATPPSPPAVCGGRAGRQ